MRPLHLPFEIRKNWFHPKMEEGGLGTRAPWSPPTESIKFFKFKKNQAPRSGRQIASKLSETQRCACSMPHVISIPQSTQCVIVTHIARTQCLRSARSDVTCCTMCVLHAQCVVCCGNNMPQMTQMQVPATWHLSPETWYLLHGTSYLVHGTQYLIHGTHEPGTR